MKWGKPETAENKISRSYRGHDAWEPEWISGTMQLSGRCENSECEQIVTAVGSFRVDVSRDRPINDPDEGYQGQRYSEFYKIDYFNPPLLLITLPEDIPRDVRRAIDRARPIVFVDPSFAATALRNSVECFLSDEGVPARNSKGSYTPLHQRIKQWKTKTGNQKVAELLQAVKWIGNEGTHEGTSLTVQEILVSLEFIEAAFHELLVAPGISQRVQTVNQSKGRFG